MDFIPVRSFDNYVEAHIVMGSLQQHNINCWLKDEYTVTIDPILSNAVGGIKLMVAGVQVARALEVLQQAQREKEKQYACPRCTSKSITRIPVSPKPLNWLRKLGALLSGNTAATINETWHCSACDLKFKKPAELSRLPV